MKWSVILEQGYESLSMYKKSAKSIFKLDRPEHFYGYSLLIMNMNKNHQFKRARF